MQLPENKMGAISLRGVLKTWPEALIVYLRSREWEAQLVDDPHRSGIVEPAHLQQVA